MATNTNLFSHDLPAASVAKITQAVTDIRKELPFLRSIPEGEANRLRKRHLDDVTLIGKGGRAVAQTPQVMPGLFATAEFIRDAALLDQLAVVSDLVKSLQTQIDDTLRLLHDETSGQQTQVYAAFQQAAKTNAEARTLFEDMKTHKEKNKNKPRAPKPA